jgi:hypothetical protein
MHERWSHLRQQLLARGWTWRDEAFYAPHETMCVAAVEDDPDLASLRRRMSHTADQVAAYVATSPDHAELHEDLISLVDALDCVLDPMIPAPVYEDTAYALAN